MGNQCSLVSMNDITALIKSKNEIININKELQIVNENKDRFFSILAHDLRSPFNSILGFSEILETEFDEMDTPTVKQCVSGIYISSKSVFGLLENLLAWGGLQNNRFDLRIEKLNICKVIDEAYLLHLLVAKNKHIELSIHLPDNCNVKADRNMIFAIIRNLVSNAIKFTPQKGNIILSATKVGSTLEVLIEDNGTGMTEDQISSIYNKEIHESTKGTDGEKGTGLGLTLCKEFLNKNHSELNIDSKVGKGTKCWFTLPLAE